MYWFLFDEGCVMLILIWGVVEEELVWLDVVVDLFYLYVDLICFDFVVLFWYVYVCKCLVWLVWIGVWVLVFGVVVDVVLMVVMCQVGFYGEVCDGVLVLCYVLVWVCLVMYVVVFDMLLWCDLLYVWQVLVIGVGLVGIVVVEWFMVCGWCVDFIDVGLEVVICVLGNYGGFFMFVLVCDDSLLVWFM